MGVKKLWETLLRDESYFDTFHIKQTTLENQDDLESERGWFALDCSIWMVENSVKTLTKGNSHDIWLRNILCRIKNLFYRGVKVISVLESPVRASGKNSDSKRFLYGSNFKFQLVNLKQTLKSLGLPWIQAPPGIEAESVCGYLYSSEIVSGVITNDSDVFVYGGYRVVRDLKINSAKSQVNGKLVQLIKKKTASKKQMQEELFLFALIMGTDFHKGIKGRGPSFFLKLKKSQRFNFLSETGDGSINSFIASKIGLSLKKRFLTSPPILESDLHVLKELKLPSLELFKRTRLFLNLKICYFFLINYQSHITTKILNIEAIKKRRLLRTEVFFECIFQYQQNKFSFTASETMLAKHFKKEIEDFLNTSKSNKRRTISSQKTIVDSLSSIENRLGKLNIENETVDLTKTAQIIDLTNDP